MMRVLIYIKHNVIIVWRMIELVNSLLVKILYKNRISRVLSLHSHTIVNDNFVTRPLIAGDVDLLYAMINSLNSDIFKFFKPHKFDKKSIERILKDDSYIKFGYFKKNKIIGYFILRLFVNKKAFIGRLVHPEYQGKGLSKEMAKILYCVAKLINFKVYSTISKKNLASLKSHKSLNDFKVIKELNDSYILIQFDLSDIEC